MRWSATTTKITAYAAHAATTASRTRRAIIRQEARSCVRPRALFRSACRKVTRMESVRTMVQPVGADSCVFVSFPWRTEIEQVSNAVRLIALARASRVVAGAIGDVKGEGRVTVGIAMTFSTVELLDAAAEALEQEA